MLDDSKVPTPDDLRRAHEAYVYRETWLKQHLQEREHIPSQKL